MDLVVALRFIVTWSIAGGLSYDVPRGALPCVVAEVAHRLCSSGVGAELVQGRWGEYRIPPWNETPCDDAHATGSEIAGQMKTSCLPESSTPQRTEDIYTRGVCAEKWVYGRIPKVATHVEQVVCG